MTSLYFHPNAQLELEEAIAYYDNFNLNFGNTFLKAVEGSLSLIVQFPEAWTSMIEDTKRYHIKGFPLWNCLQNTRRSHCSYASI